MTATMMPMMTMSGRMKPPRSSLPSAASDAGATSAFPAAGAAACAAATVGAAASASAPRAVQLNLRYDYLDLSSGGIAGGRQSGYQASLIWIPQDHVRFLLNYGYLRYEDAAIAAAGGDRDYGISVIGARAQVDF